MTRGEEFEKLEFRATREKNNSLFESLFHPDCTYESNLIPIQRVLSMSEMTLLGHKGNIQKPLVKPFSFVRDL